MGLPSCSFTKSLEPIDLYRLLVPEDIPACMVPATISMDVVSVTVSRSVGTSNMETLEARSTYLLARRGNPLLTKIGSVSRLRSWGSKWFPFAPAIAAARMGRGEGVTAAAGAADGGGRQ